MPPRALGSIRIPTQGFLILDKLPSLRLGRYCLLSRSLGALAL